MSNDRSGKPYDPQKHTSSQWPYGWEFFKNDKVNLNWVNDYAKETAEKLNLSSTQIRAFYNEFLRIRDLPGDPEEKKILIKLLIAKVNYRSNNSSSGTKVPKDFVDFITHLANAIGEDTDKKLKTACHIFEAVVGFSKK